MEGIELAGTSILAYRIDYILIRVPVVTICNIVTSRMESLSIAHTFILTAHLSDLVCSDTILLYKAKSLVSNFIELLKHKMMLKKSLLSNNEKDTS